LANRLAHEVLGRSLDELPPQTRRLLDLLAGTVAERAAAQGIDRDQARLSRRELRQATGWGDTQLKVHLARLVDLELVIAHRAERGGGFVYELAWDGAGRDGERFLIGLTDPTTLADPTGKGRIHVYDDSRSGPEGAWSGSGRPPVGRRSAPGRGAPEAGNPLPGHGSTPLDGSHTGEGTVPGGGDGRVVVIAAAGGNGRVR
jgi:hypothetical protein